MKIITTILFILSVNVSFGQATVRHYKKLIKNGFPEDTAIDCINKQYDYLKACDWLGNYYLEKKMYGTAFIYYMLPLVLNGHAYNIQTDSAYKLKNRIIAKAGDMMYAGKGVKKDTISSFYCHYQYPISYSIVDKQKYSFLYFKTTKDTFNIVPKEEARATYYFAINPYMLSEKQTQEKIAKAINIYSLNKDSVSIVLYKGGIPISEEGQAICWKCLDGVKEFLQLQHTTIKIGREVNMDESKITKIVNGRSFPMIAVQAY